MSDALPSLRGNALLRHERGHKMVYVCNNLIIIYPIKLTGIEIEIVSIISILEK